METDNQPVRDYIAARRGGDRANTHRIVRDVAARFATRTTDGTEARDLAETSMTIPFGSAGQ